MTLIRTFLLLVFGALIGACETTPEQERKRLETDLIAQYCAIGFAAIDQLRAERILADPEMVRGCPFPPDFPDVEIGPKVEATPPSNGFALGYYQNMLERRYPPALARQIVGSEAFAELIKIRTQLDLLQIP